MNGRTACGITYHTTKIITCQVLGDKNGAHEFFLNFRSEIIFASILIFAPGVLIFVLFQFSLLK